MAILPKAIYVFHTIPVKIPMTYITEIEKSTLKFIWKHKRLWIAKTILDKKSNAGDITTTDFKLYYRVIAIKTAWYWHKNRYEDWWYRIEDSDMNPLHPPDFWQRQKLKLDPCLSPCRSINSKWNKDLNIGPETLKLVQEKAGNTLE
jgi:hypothetical protein